MACLPSAMPMDSSDWARIPGFDNFDHLTRLPRANSHHADPASEFHRGQVHQATRVSLEGHVPGQKLILSSTFHLPCNLELSLFLA